MGKLYPAVACVAMLCVLGCNAQFNPFTLSERQLDNLSVTYGVRNCWNYIKNNAFGGRYSPQKAAAMGSSLRPTLQRLARQGPCRYEVPNSPVRSLLN